MVIVVVAIPEGLPLAVTIALAYSTKKMYKDKCFIRVLAACETMGNATNICSDKTGTLTENVMTVVCGWFADVFYNEDQFRSISLKDEVRSIVVNNMCVNRVAYLMEKDQEGKPLSRPAVIGNKTEGALLLLVRSWGFDCEAIKKELYDDVRDKIFAFNSSRKRATAIIHRSDGSVRLYCKGATEWLLKDCTQYLAKNGQVMPLTLAQRAELERCISGMTQGALRTLLLAHRDFAHSSTLPADWRDHPPDMAELCCDCIVGIIDPLRSDVIEAVATAQRAGVTVRMVTGDNIETASAIARQCGILTKGGLAMEGPTFRAMTPAQVDYVLPRLQVLARSSPEDKYLLVTRLNGNGLPDNEEDWMQKHRDVAGATWDKSRDLLMPGYLSEWQVTRPDGGEVVGVTGDGTNDAPALKAADVGLAMGITGTKVAQGASDIVILDDKFSSIVRAIMWGRSVYDAIRKFLQFQLTVNVVALLLAFIGAVQGFGQPLTAVMMLWVNLIMDTMGALALATEPPSMELLNRRPYKRSSSLVSWPMWRNILCQSAFQLTLLLLILFTGVEMFGIQENGSCMYYSTSPSNKLWDPYVGSVTANMTFYTIKCETFKDVCGTTPDCAFEYHPINGAVGGEQYKFADLNGYIGSCLTCTAKDYRHGSIIFNVFVFCQIFNEINSRMLFDEFNVFRGIFNNSIFIWVILVSIGCQVLLVQVGGEALKTSPLNAAQFLITVALASIGLIVGLLSKLIPVKEDPHSFFVSSGSANRMGGTSVLGDDVNNCISSSSRSHGSNIPFCTQVHPEEFKTHQLEVDSFRSHDRSSI